MTSPSWSTARQRYCRFPWMVTKTSSKCHVSPRRPCRCYSPRAYSGRSSPRAFVLMAHGARAMYDSLMNDDLEAFNRLIQALGVRVES